MPRPVKYSDEQIADAVRLSRSYVEVMQRIGTPHCAGSLHAHIKKRIAKAALDVSHFDHKPRVPRVRADVLVVRDRRLPRVKRYRLAPEMRKTKPYLCAICGQVPSWNGKELTLEIDHINGDWGDNRLENLRFLCPNCHSQVAISS